MHPLPRYAPLENVLLSMVTEAIEGSLQSDECHVIVRVESAGIKHREARSEAQLSGTRITVVDQGVYDIEVRVHRTLLDKRGHPVGGDVNEMTVSITPDDVWRRLLTSSLEATVEYLLPRWRDEYPLEK